MKKVLLPLFAITLAISVKGQKVTLIEQVTSASCGPCAAVNPNFNALLDANLGDVAVIKYQRGGGNYIDPMFDFNPNEVNGRIVSYYQMTSFPQVWIDGTHISGGPSQVDQLTIDNANAETQTFDIQLTHELVSNDDSLKIEARFIAMDDFQETEDVLLKSYIIVNEKTVDYSSAPGTNGEKNFSNVMRKMLPHQNGFTLGKQVNGDTTYLSYTYWIDKSEMDPDDLYAVAFVQRSPTKEVFQAANSVEKSALSTSKLVKDEAGVQLYPTPANNELFIKTNTTIKNADARIFNSLGKIVSQFQVNNSIERINASELSNGMYFLSIDAGNDQTITKKFIVNH